MVHSGIGEDCSIIGFGENCCVLSCDPITGSSSNIGWLAVHISCNDIAASGVEPIGILVTILAPGSTNEKDIYDLMKEINRAASEINVEILGGHTEITESVNKIIVTTTAIGKGAADKYITSAGAKPGDSIIVTKFAGLEGTSIIANDYEEYLKDKLDKNIIENAKKFIDIISVVKEGLIGGKLQVSSMHDATEGGLLGAIWEVAEASGTGFEIYKDLIPITLETKEICRVMDIDPLRLISSGMMIITTRDRYKLLETLKLEGISAAYIGNIVENINRKIMVNDGAEIDVIPPQNDELFNINIKKI